MTVRSTADFDVPAALYSTGWGAALARDPKIKVLTQSVGAGAPQVASMRPPRRRKPKVYSYEFDVPEQPQPAAKESRKPSQTPNSPNAAACEPGTTPAASTTRLRPPPDTVKLQDRLWYLLQPPLETLLTGESLTFPFQPFPYQFTGIAFLYSRHAAILADEMGLGKTMQAISAIRLLLCAGEARRVLLICPKPLVTNWQREFALWSPEIPVTIIEGDQTRRHWQWRLPEAPVRIANYELLVRDKDVIDSLPAPFDLVVLDEAQRIKNRHSSTSQIARSIPRSRNWALTGTPIENSSDDLLGIFEFLSPGYLHSEMNPRSLGRAARDYLLRRTKQNVLTDLPPKMIRDAELSLSPAQQYSYERAEKEGVVELAELEDQLTIQHVFELVLRLKQICNFDPATGESSKLERLIADLEEVAASGKKAIVFSQWTDTIARMRGPLARFGPLEYHGKVPSKKRDAVIDRFKSDPNCHVILMSYGAGSVGLNLQFCEYVFLFDRWWNPAVEDQAINRAHRIGAAGPVTVTRMLALGTIEERINDVLERKRELFDLIVNQAGEPRKLGMTQQEIFGLFNLRTPQGPIDAAA